MTKNRLGSVCGALPWKLDIRSSTYAGIRNAQNEPTGIVLMSKGTPTQKAAMNYIIQCANLMPEAVRLLNEALRIIEKACIACANIDAYHCGFCGREETTQEIKEFLAKLEGCCMSDFELLQRIIADRFYIEDYGEVKPEDNFKNDLMSDWLGMIELIEDVEHEFSISIPDAEFDKIKTVSDLMQCIERAKGGANNAPNP